MSLISKKDEQRNEWDIIWANKKNISKIITSGRTIYNYFFMLYLKKYITKRTSFCEVGCGTSSFLLGLSKEVKKATGIDYSDEALKESKKQRKLKNIKNVFFVKEDIQDLKLKQGLFDIVWSQGLIEHFSNPLQVIANHLKICKKDGLIFILVPFKYSYLWFWYHFTRNHLFRWAWPWTDQFFFSKWNLISYMEKLKKDYPLLKFNNYEVSNIKPAILGILSLKIKK